MEHKKDLITNLLVQICKLQRKNTNALLSQAGVHSGQDILLYFLSSEDGQTISSLVEKMCNQHATLFTMVDRMEATGMVRKEKDALDKRISRVYITPKGREAYEVVCKTWCVVEDISIKGLTLEQETTLYSLLQQVHKNLS
jgi:DNA-binding MarR family transcriptional regulator